MALAIKDPEARIDYAIDWRADYIDEQVIAASSWHVAPIEAGGLTVDSASHDLMHTVARVSGGVPGHLYQLTNHIVLSDGQRDERSIAIRVDAR